MRDQLGAMFGWTWIIRIKKKKEHQKELEFIRSAIQGWWGLAGWPPSGHSGGTALFDHPFEHTCTKDVLVLVHVLLYLYVLLYPVNQSGTTKYKLYRIFRFFATKTARIRSTVKVKITKFIQPIWFKKIGVYLSWMLSKNMPQNWKSFSPYLKKVFMVIFVKKRPEITSKHLYFDRNPGKRLYSNLYLKNIDEFCLFCTLYLKKIDEVQVHGTFVLEMKIDLKYNLGYRMLRTWYWRSQAQFQKLCEQFSSRRFQPIQC